MTAMAGTVFCYVMYVTCLLVSCGVYNMEGMKREVTVPLKEAVR